MPLALELLVVLLDRAGLRLVQGALGEPGVEVDAVALQRGADPGHHELGALPPELVRVGLGGARQLGRQIAHVVALVAALGDLLTARPGADRLAELAHLGPVVVDVVLALHLVRRRTRGSAPAHRRRRRGGPRPRSAGRSGWPTRTRPGPARSATRSPRRRRRRRPARRAARRGTRRRPGRG